MSKIKYVVDNRRASMVRRLNDGHNDDEDNDQDDDADDDAHLHIFPPHIFAYTVCSTPEPLSRYSEVVCFVLQSLQPLSSLSDLCDIFSHYTDRIVNLGLDCSRLWVSLTWSGNRGWRGAIPGKVGIVRFRHYFES